MLISIVLASASPLPSWAEPDVLSYNRLLGRGMNLGNALEAPKEGEWGVTLKPEYFQEIKDAGFNSVRIPIQWSTHAGSEAPYRIDPAFFARVDWAIDQALSRNLTAVINVHHYWHMDREPAKNLPRLVELWKQIAPRYQNRPQSLFFELLNEPHGDLTDERWQKIFPELLRAVRETNPSRMIIIGPAYWNGVGHLPQLQLPPDDRRLIATFHYYQPFRFTHQGASWIPESEAWRGTKWTDSPREHAELRKDFEEAARWANQNQRPLYVGEFGANDQVDMDGRALWTRAVAREAEKWGFSWAYWEFCAKFGAYDRVARTWRQPLLRALLGKD